MSLINAFDYSCSEKKFQVFFYLLQQISASAPEAVATAAAAVIVFFSLEQASSIWVPELPGSDNVSNNSSDMFG